MSQTWHIITCEYPPQIGGVSDYTRLLALQLRKAGDEVHIWAPSHVHSSPESQDSGVILHRALGRFRPEDLRSAADQIQVTGSQQLLVQYVPHGYGYRSMNIGFCRWIQSLSRAGHRIYLMVHEPYLESRGSWKQRLASQVHRWMIRTLLRSSSRAFMSIPGWEEYLRPYAPDGLKLEWLPIPATIEATLKPNDRDSVLRIGHLGTYSAEMCFLLEPIVLELLNRHPECEILLLGRGSDEFADHLGVHQPKGSCRIKAAGLLSDVELSHQISSCRVMLQPYPDGLSSRRTSLMNSLSHGIAVVSNCGHLTEDFWSSSNAVALASTQNMADECLRLLTDTAARDKLAFAGQELYRSRFDWPHVVSTLRSSPESRAAHTK